jgi:outer membrane biosynthesis protein TonB
MTSIRFAGLLLGIVPLSCASGEASRPVPVAPASSAPAAQSVAPAASVAAAPSAAPSSNPDADAVEAARPSFSACYDRARSANPALGHTTVTVSVRVDETGHVSSVDLVYKHRFDDASKQCMRDAAFAIKLPPGQPRRVEVPMSLGPR